MCGLVTTNSAAAIGGRVGDDEIHDAVAVHAGDGGVLAVGAASAIPPKPTRLAAAIPVATMSCESFTWTIPAVSALRLG